MRLHALQPQSVGFARLSLVAGSQGRLYHGSSWRHCKWPSVPCEKRTPSGY